MQIWNYDPFVKLPEKLPDIAPDSLEADFIPQGIDVSSWITPPAIKSSGEISVWIPVPPWRMARFRNLGWKKRRRWKPVIKAIRLWHAERRKNHET